MRSPSFTTNTSSHLTQTPLDQAVNGAFSPDTPGSPFRDVSGIPPSHPAATIAEERRAQRRPEPLRRISSHRRELAIAVREDQTVSLYVK